MKHIHLILVISTIVSNSFCINVNDFYRQSRYESVNLVNGDDKFEYVKLETPIHFYSETYDDIYVNTNGILTFGTDFPNFINLPFPLEYPAIAPFYTNVDISGSRNARISYFKTNDTNVLYRASDLVKTLFSDSYDFQASDLFVATWENVGYFNGKSDKLNTYQVVIICSKEETYIQYLFPSDGLNWIQGEIGESGLPDVRAQSGFVSEDGRYFTLRGSATDNVRHLNEFSNSGEPGLWLYRVGPLLETENIEEPDTPNSNIEKIPLSCSDGGRLKCHSAANCIDTRFGYCCNCKTGYYGNGYNCLKDDAPVRVSGKISGTINNLPATSQLQSYVVMVDGRSYTALSPLTPDIGLSLQLLQILGGPIGWLFAKPFGKSMNGYQITGGKFNHTSVIYFEGSNEILQIVQRFQGLNAWDQLSVDIEMNGNLPAVGDGVVVSMKDYIEEYNFVEETKIKSIGHRQVQLNNEELIYSIEQQIDFEKCVASDNVNPTDTSTMYNKISKISMVYQTREKALRIGMLNKIVLDINSNPCVDGSAICGENTICIPVEDDSYNCECKNGFAPNQVQQHGIESCVDINECNGVNICDENAECINELGGYSCKCHFGYTGNGNTCFQNVPEQIPTQPVPPSSSSSSSSSLSIQHYPTESDVPTTISSLPSFPTLAPEYYQCDQCSENADCIDGICICITGWHGDGIVCKPNCPANYVWTADGCTPVSPPSTNSEDIVENEVEPFCHQQGCSCPTGYELVEYSIGQICRLIDDSAVDNVSEEVKIPCDVDDNCSPNASCMWIESELMYKCICHSGYDGDGYDCTERTVSCIYENICDIHASCTYDENVGKSVCKCNPGYEGNGMTCTLAPECSENLDCGTNSYCNYGICTCLDGFEHDLSGFCIPVGLCGGAYCAENAICKYDDFEHISYCHCPEGFIGDGVKSCKSLPPPCNIKNNCGLHALCVPSYREPLKYECVCNSGYYGDGLVCIQEVNCLNVPSLCHLDADCVSMTSGLQCICKLGFIGNGSHCIEQPKHESGFLLLSQGVATVRVPFDGRQGRPVSMSSMAIGLDKDCSEGRVYWSDISAKNIMSAKFDGSDRKSFLSNDIFSPEGIAIDWVSRRIYWTDSTKDTIEVASLDNSTLRSVIINKNLVNPRGIAVDPHLNKIFWSDWNRYGPKIEWANLDGSEREILLSDPSVKLPNSLAISPSTGELCFADAGTYKIDCIDTYSKIVRNIAGNLSYPFGLAITVDHFYWTDWTTKKIESVDFYQNRKLSISSPLFGNHKMYGMVAVTDRCPIFFSPCQLNNGDCPENRLCLINSRSATGRSCKCITSADCNDLILDV